MRLLCWAAGRWGSGWQAFFVHSAFQPAFELRDARRLAAGLAADLVVLEQDILENPEVSANPADRCYHCKNTLFRQILRAAENDGFPDRRHQRLRRPGRPAGNAGAEGAFGALSPRALRHRKAGGAVPFP